MNKFLQVDSKAGLVRDMSSGAIINNSSSDYDNYQKRQLLAKERMSKIEQQEIDINNIKTDLVDIKQILLSMIERNVTRG